MTKIYSDASYSHVYDVGVCGIMIDDNIMTNIVHNMKNTQLEILSVMNAFDYVLHNDMKKCMIFTDCQRVYDLYHSEYSDKRYTKFYERLKLCRDRVNIVHISGHTKNKYKNEDDVEFSKLDKHVRKLLRFTVKEM